MGVAGVAGTVLVTGVGHHLGALLAARLVDDSRVDRVIGIDSIDPVRDVVPLLDGLDVRRVDLRSPELAEIILGERITTVVHLGVATVPDLARGGRQAMKENNIIGTMKLLSVCQGAPQLTGLIVRSSTAAYGVSFRDPAVFTEDTEPRAIPRGGFARDVLDIEGYVRGFHRRRPEVRVTVFRFAPFVGSYTETSLTRYFARPVVPTVLGRDPRMQFLHIDDGMEVLHRAVVEAHPGTFNAAGRGVLLLSQAVRRAGRIGAPILEQGLDVATFLPRGIGAGFLSRDQLDLLVHGRVVDTTRLVEEFGILPRPTAIAFDDFVRSHRETSSLTPEAVRSTEQRLLAGFRGARQALREWVEVE